MGALLGATWGILAEYLGNYFFFNLLYESTELWPKIVFFPLWSAMQISEWNLIKPYATSLYTFFLPIFSVVIGVVIGIGLQSLFVLLRSSWKPSLKKPTFTNTAPV